MSIRQPVDAIVAPWHQHPGSEVLPGNLHPDKTAATPNQSRSAAPGAQFCDQLLIAPQAHVSMANNQFAHREAASYPQTLKRIPCS